MTVMNQHNFDQSFDRCPGTLARGHQGYSPICLKKVFGGRKVSPYLNYDSPMSNNPSDNLFEDSRTRISISGVQEKYAVIQEKNTIRLVKEGERGTHILKPIPHVAKNADQMPANEHLTMQIASQVFNIETAANAMVFFKDGSPAYITRRFDINGEGKKLAQEDFAALDGRTPQTHGEHFKYQGNYLDMFRLLQKYVPAYPIESVKLFKLIAFNYLFSNGDAHFKNFSLIETAQGDFKLSPAYDLLNSRIHITDHDFALDDGLLPKKESSGTILHQFYKLGELASVNSRQIDKALNDLQSKQLKVEELIMCSFLSNRIKKNYLQAYQTRLKRFTK